MNSSHHAGLSLVTTLAVLAVLEPARPAELLLAGTVVGVAIDIDHFPIARARDGDWSATMRVLRNPLSIVTDPERIFADSHVHSLERLLSHAVLAGPLCVLTWTAWPTLGIVVGASLYVHLLADLVWDVWRLHSVPDGESTGA